MLVSEIKLMLHQKSDQSFPSSAALVKLVQRLQIFIIHLIENSECNVPFPQQCLCILNFLH